MIRALLALLFLFAADAASAHLTPNSEVMIDAGARHVTVTAKVPIGELDYALGTPLAQASVLSAEDRARLARYFAEHVAIAGGDGPRWPVQLRRVARDDETSVLVEMCFTAPGDAPVRHFKLHYAAVIDRVSDHFVIVLLRSDYAGGRLPEQPELLGGLQQDRSELTVDLGPSRPFQGFGSAMLLGMHHIAGGHDHILFLLTLLLPAPLAAIGGRWRGYVGTWRTLRRLAAIVSAFTIGHSLTLIAGAFAGWTLPQASVESAIAASILVSAVNAWRPIFAGREPWVAAGFGLIHGMAFATVLGNFRLDPWAKAGTIFGFNLGIECVQLLIIAAVAPVLVFAAREGRFYGWFRTIMAMVAGIAALVWLVERIGGSDNIVGHMLDMILGGWTAAAILVTLLVGAFTARRLRPSA